MNEKDKQIIKSTLHTLTELLYDLKIENEKADYLLLEQNKIALLKLVDEDLFSKD